MNAFPTESLRRTAGTGRIRRPAGFTLVELLVALLLIGGVLLLVFNGMAQVRNRAGIGTVNLQNLQEARLAINTLRRDFATACPIISGRDPGKARQRVRRSPVVFSAGPLPQQQSAPLVVRENELLFTRFRPGREGEPPTIEPVQYSFDPTSQRLTRTVPGTSKVFSGIRQARFRLYRQAANPTVPLVWAQLEIQQGERTPAGPPLEMVTTLACPVAADLTNHPDWNVLGIP